MYTSRPWQGDNFTLNHMSSTETHNTEEASRSIMIHFTSYQCCPLTQMLEGCTKYMAGGHGKHIAT